MRILIIDDERRIREGLRSLIDWHKLGITDIDTASNGLEGLEKIELYAPDIIVTDIKMPKMNGIEMISQLNQLNKDYNIIILSGHAEFEYAKEALKLGVSDYILKPIDETVLEEKLNIMVEKIEKKRNEKAYLSHSIRHSKGYMIGKWIYEDWFKEVELINRQYNMNFPWEKYQILLFSPEEISNQLVFNIKEFESIPLDGIFDNYCWFELQGYLGFLCNLDFNNRNRRKAIKLKHEIEAIMKENILCSIAKPVYRIEELKIAYQQARQMIKDKFILGYKGILSWEMELPIVKIEEDDFDLSFESLANYIEAKMLSNINHFIEKFIAKQLLISAAEEDIKLACTSLFVSVLGILKSSTRNINVYDINEVDTIKKINSARSLQELQGDINYLLISAANTQEESADMIIEQTIRFIGNHYMENMKLIDLADTFGYSSSHFGKIFKQYTGKSFNSFLNEFRLEKAKKMLESGMKVFEVAEKVGYCDVRYFQSKFSEHFGVPPSHFKS